MANRGAVCLSLAAAMVTTACAASHATSLQAPVNPGPAPNIQVAFPLESCVGTMLVRSGTFRRTYAVIATDRRVRVNVALEPTRPGAIRAETTLRTFDDGKRVAEIRLHAIDGLVELVAHEMEHVREQLEGTNLLLLSAARGSDVQRLGTTFETSRGIEAGLRVAREVGPTTVRLCDTSVRTAALRPFPF